MTQLTPALCEAETALRTALPTLAATAADNLRSPLPAYLSALSAALGPMYWWPGRTRFEIIVGAILTQNTSWSNASRAIANLRRERLLTPVAMERVATPKLARLIRSSGYFRQKAKKLKSFLRFLRRQYGGSLSRMFRAPTETLRPQLLAVRGIGPETADCILLYAGSHAVFVVDAYTHRILERHGLWGKKPDYEAVRTLFEESLPRDAAVYNEFHALIVSAGKNWCRPRDPQCHQCPLQQFLPEPHAHERLRPLTSSSLRTVSFA